MEAEVEMEWRDDGAPGVRGLGFEATPANWGRAAEIYQHCTLHELGACGVAGSSP